MGQRESGSEVWPGLDVAVAGRSHVVASAMPCQCTEVGRSETVCESDGELVADVGPNQRDRGWGYVGKPWRAKAVHQGRSVAAEGSTRRGGSTTGVWQRLSARPAIAVEPVAAGVA